jgi:hypothetical protein
MACSCRKRPAKERAAVDNRPRRAKMRGMSWNQPYLETCCRAALHRLHLAADDGRPDGLKDGPCLKRLAEMGLADQRTDGRFLSNEAGEARHGSEILKLA